ncbi:MAG TPA: (deoxy)nucleoside triphosphate pyrophosphohydrolase [Thermoanaerobaculia bacterium]|nr:(deoxy)nucleoside triphosphate pyrophosphohydrolase [Thermoanaerobaculia bacterium]
MGDLRIHVVGAAIVRGGRVLVTRRGPAMALAGKWEFPGGKVETGEDPRAALRREIAEELGVTVTVGALLGRGTAPAGEREIVLDVYAARLEAGEIAPVEHSEWGWFDADALGALDWAEADLPVLDPLDALLRAGS